MDNKNQMNGSTDTILMIEPVAFGFNTETAVNNYFQQENDSDIKKTQELALNEFNKMVEKLRKEGVNVITIKDTLTPHTPDSIFPNNWVSFHPGNQAVLYPMFAQNRRLESKKGVLEKLEKILDKKYNVIDYSVKEKDEIILEGTGSIVLDRFSKIAYACLSQRTDKDLFVKFCNDLGFKPVYFNATHFVENERLPIYHTNVMMCAGNKFILICLEAIEDDYEREMVVKSITDSGKEVVEISLEQMNCFAGNMIQIKNKENNHLLVLSQAAFDSLSKDQIDTLKKYSKLIVNPVPTIEKNGGGSVRCMIAEVY